ncbi:MFS transporter [Algicella marina]|uniref:MFS transporter n=1 Tax=Algicella marina TaxID=2683284 RepID=A0A6P1SYL4_9RHOB|nr:MFS transporter [Algicella marina]QHQ35774.1 MFS transporter [Algicella marina]
MRILLSFSALMLSVVLLQLSSGAIAPLDALSGLQEGFTTTEVGLLGSAHFIGFFAGCWWAPRLMGRVGHNRAFAAFAALGAIGALAHPLLISPVAWSLMRVMTGLCIAGAYTIVEAWLQARLTNASRGRVLGAYRFFDLCASMVAQLMIGFLEPASYVSYNLLAILCCACLLPLMLTTAPPPVIPATPRLRPMIAVRLSPLGAAGVIVAGISGPAFRMVGPVYGQEMGLGADQIGLFLAAAVLGGALAQFPVGWLADKFDRRVMLIGMSIAACIVCIALSNYSGTSAPLIFGGSFAFGLTSFPVFSISAAHASDFAEPEEMVELSAALMFLYGTGAIVSPIVASGLIDLFGPPAMFLLITAGHAALIAFGLVRMQSRSAKKRTAYRYTPRTSFTIGQILRRKPAGK